MKSKKGAFDIEDIFAYLAFVAMVLFFLVLLMIRSGWGIPLLGKSADKEVLNSNALAVVEAREGLNFMNFLKQTAELNGEQMTMSELLSRYYYGDKYMDVPDDVKKAQKEKIQTSIDELYSQRCISIVLKDKGGDPAIQSGPGILQFDFKGDAPTIRFGSKACEKCELKFPYDYSENVIHFEIALPSEYGNGLNWIKAGVFDIGEWCKK